MLAAITLSVGTGLRQGELLRLDWSDVDLVKHTLRVRITKNGDERTVHLPESAAAALKALRTGKVVGVAVFIAPNGDRLTKAQLEKRWKRVRTLAGLEDFRWHDLRHTAAQVDAKLRGASS